MQAPPATQVFVYPEELDATEPSALAEQVAGLGLDAVSVALAYHRARRVLPRQGRISLSPGGAISFTPDRARYGLLVPEPTAPVALRRAVESFRDACRTAGIRFHAWLVALHSEPLALAHPEVAALTVDGSTTGFSLCPSTDEAVAYVTALVTDVCAQLEPESIDLEAALYPAWDPSYTLTLSLDELSERARLYGAQCFCSACRRLPGLAAAAGRTKAAAGPPFAPAEAEMPELEDELSAARAVGVERLLTAAASAAHGAGGTLCVTTAGTARSARLRGLSPQTAAIADRVLFGLGTLPGPELEARLSELVPLAGDRPVTASLNWAPGRTPDALADDALRAAACGAQGIALYNLSLVPERGLEAFRAAAGAFHARAPA